MMMIATSEWTRSQLWSKFLCSSVDFREPGEQEAAVWQLSSPEAAVLDDLWQSSQLTRQLFQTMQRQCSWVYRYPVATTEDTPGQEKDSALSPVDTRNPQEQELAKGLLEALRAFCSARAETNISAMLTSIREIMSEELEECDIRRPTPHSLLRVLSILLPANQMMLGELPRGAVASDTEGGIRIEWRSGEKEVRLVVSDAERQESYIYYEEGDEYDIETNPESGTLANWLRWLIGP